MSDSEKTVSVKLTPQWIERLDKLAQKGDLSRHQLMRNLIEIGIKGINLSSKVGLFQIGLAIRNLSNEPPFVEAGEEKPLPLKLDEKLLAKLDSFAERSDRSRHQLMRNFIHIGVEELESAARFGAFQLAVVLRNFGYAVKNIIKDGERAREAVLEAQDDKETKGGDKE